MKQWIPLKIVLIVGLLFLVQYFVPHESFEFLYEYGIDFTIIIGIFALALGIWSLVRVTYDKIRRKAPGRFYNWVILFGLVVMLFFGFWPSRVGNVGDTPVAVEFGDVDFDQDGDVIVANYDSDNISIFKNKGNGQFVSAYTFPAGKTPRDLELLDLDGDNDLDIVVVNEQSNAISVLINDGKAADYTRKRLQITADNTLDSAFNVGKPKYGKPVAYDCGTTPTAIAHGDLNGDGRANDLVVANSGSDNVSVLINNGDGSFASAVNIPVGKTPVGVYVADFTRDLKNDIVVVNEGSGEITLLSGNGDGTFEFLQNFILGDMKLTALTSGDFDKNGYFDLAVTGYFADGAGHDIYLLRSDSNGIFNRMDLFATGSTPVAIFGADVDLDGNRDLVVTSMDDNMVYVHRNDGAADFHESARFFAGRSPVQAITGHVRGNERPDIIIANRVSNAVATLSNRGDLDFEPGVNLASGDILYVGGNLSNYFYYQFFFNIMIPIQATMFSMLAFYIASAAYRAFRARSLLASILLVAALIIMIRFVPLGPISNWISDISAWILKVPNMAAKRAIFIGVGLGMVATAIKVLLGIERSYLGRD